MSDREMTAAEIRAECERLWNRPGLQFDGARTVWTMGGAGLHSIAGAPCRTNAGPGDAYWRRAWRDYGPPPPANYKESSATYCPKSIRARYRELCPKNWRALVASYGVTVDRFDRALNRKATAGPADLAPTLPGLLKVETDAAPIAPAAPAIDPATMSDEALETAAAPIFAEVARELSEYVANVRESIAADIEHAARFAAETAAERPPTAPEAVTAPEAPKAATARRRPPRARRTRDMAPPTIWQARALGLVAAPSKKPRADARHAWRV